MFSWSSKVFLFFISLLLYNNYEESPSIYLFLSSKLFFNAYNSFNNAFTSDYNLDMVVLWWDIKDWMGLLHPSSNFIT